MTVQRFIVAEISKTWRECDARAEGFLHSRFEEAIAHNAEHGYRLHSWQYGCTAYQFALHETILAVFERSRREVEPLTISEHTATCRHFEASDCEACELLAQLGEAFLKVDANRSLDRRDSEASAAARYSALWKVARSLGLIDAQGRPQDPTTGEPKGRA